MAWTLYRCPGQSLALGVGTILQPPLVEVTNVGCSPSSNNAAAVPLMYTYASSTALERQKLNQASSLVSIHCHPIFDPTFKLYSGTGSILLTLPI
jgi:hypothetical protein